MTKKTPPECRLQLKLQRNLLSPRQLSMTDHSLIERLQRLHGHLLSLDSGSGDAALLYEAIIALSKLPEHNNSLLEQLEIEYQQALLRRKNAVTTRDKEDAYYNMGKCSAYKHACTIIRQHEAEDTP